MITILYHGSCFDGTAAAWVTSHALEDHGLEDPTLIPCSYGDPPPDIKDSAVYIVDFSFPRETMLQLQKNNKSIQVLDHHKTAQASCSGLPFCLFDMNRSGAGIAWDFFYPDVARPALVNYIEDRDLWRFKLPFSKEIYAYIASFPKELSIYDTLHVALEKNFTDCCIEGTAILRYHAQKVAELSELASLQFIAGHLVPVLNAPYQYASDVLHSLLERYPESAFAASYFYRADGTKQFSLRGRDTDDFDVSEVAKKFGGGGHKKAAGYEIKEKH